MVLLQRTRSYTYAKTLNTAIRPIDWNFLFNVVTPDIQHFKAANPKPQISFSSLQSLSLSQLYVLNLCHLRRRLFHRQVFSIPWPLSYF